MAWAQEDIQNLMDISGWKKLSTELAPHRGHVSNFCNLKRSSLEPVELLSGQWRTGETDALIQTGHPGQMSLEPMETGSRRDIPLHGSIFVNGAG